MNVPGYSRARVGAWLDSDVLASVRNLVVSATDGSPMVIVDHPSRVEEDLARLWLVGPKQLPGVLRWLPPDSRARIVVVAPSISDSLLRDAASNQVTGILGWPSDGSRGWELSFLIRRLTSEHGTMPTARDLLSWGANTVHWRPDTSAERDNVVKAVEKVCYRFGVGSRLANRVASAAHEMLMNAMVNAPVDARGEPRFADRTEPITLPGGEVPRLTFAVDHERIALEVTDPFGRLDRASMFSAIERGRQGEGRLDAPGAGIGFYQLFQSASILQAQVARGSETRTTWVTERGAWRSDQPGFARSLYFVQLAAFDTPLFRVLKWAHRTGSAKALERIRLRTLPYAFIEGINVLEADPSTDCSPALLQRVRDAASSIVGRPCPF